MKLTGTYDIPAPQDAVWAALNDPEVLAACIPGCESLEADGDSAFNAVVAAKVGPVRAKFKGAVTLSDMDPPNAYRISGEGQGGAAGFAKGGADVRLEEIPDGTRLTYDVDATVGGKLAQIGQRLIDSTAKKMADDFFGAFNERLGGGNAEEATAATPATPSPAPQSGSDERGFDGTEKAALIGLGLLFLILLITQL